MNGDCFKVAAELAMKMGDTASVVLCHGRPVYRGSQENPDPDGRHWHAWVEETVELNHPDLPRPICMTHVHDVANSQDIHLPAALYYKVGEMDDEHITRYGVTEAMIEMVRTGHYGPWSE